MATVNPKPTAKPRRVSVKELAKANRSLKRQVKKENKRAEDIARFRKENEELSLRLYQLRNERNTTGECC